MSSLRTRAWLDISALSNEEFAVYAHCGLILEREERMSSDECAGVLINRFSFSFSNVSAAFNALFGSERTCTLTLAREELLAVIRLLSHASNYTQWQYFLFEQTHPHPNFRRSKQSNTIQDGKGSENKAAEKHPPPPPPPRRTFSDKNPFSNLLQSSKPHLPPRQSAPDTQTETASTSTRNQNDVREQTPEFDAAVAELADIC
ncbi:hypothetical protein J056_003920 [Wallemia ichthyophaga EXF-994]|uniref:Uncharacterized protein n=1 Tax=Wallemia ichthyophaga (strain EXF-994 / CBS 113033) TaxID=1299270 RepID=R9AHJ8_WALI9|nr:uncharacterized protein J056_003920 [Wallemia ichthyophaga EXF-994]EOR01684.1 hypothetical protein J056_003920 [Wallemia ichthyophaga EXF-994]